MAKPGLPPASVPLKACLIAPRGRPHGGGRRCPVLTSPGGAEQVLCSSAPRLSFETLIGVSSPRHRPGSHSIGVVGRRAPREMAAGS